jgi:hypothetical protein
LNHVLFINQSGQTPLIFFFKKKLNYPEKENKFPPWQRGLELKKLRKQIELCFKRGFFEKNILTRNGKIRFGGSFKRKDPCFINANEEWPGM